MLASTGNTQIIFAARLMDGERRRLPCFHFVTEMQGSGRRGSRVAQLKRHGFGSCHKEPCATPHHWLKNAVRKAAAYPSIALLSWATPGMIAAGT